MKTKEDLILEQLNILSNKIDNIEKSLKLSYSSDKLHNNTVKYYNDVIKLMIQWSVMDRVLIDAVQLYFGGGDWKANLTPAYLKTLAFKLGLAWTVKGVVAPVIAEYIATPIHENIYEPIKDKLVNIASDVSSSYIYESSIKYAGETLSEVLAADPQVKIY